MESQYLKDFKKLWTNACHTMWIEILALRNLEAYLKGNYSNIPRGVYLTDIVYTPEIKGRIDGIDKDFFLENIETYIQYNVTTLRVVLLSAAFESYFKSFLDKYIRHRHKYFIDGSRTKEGNQVFGQVMSTSGLAERVVKFAELTNAKISAINPLLATLKEVYLLRNIIAHRAGICDSYASAEMLIVKVKEGERITISPETLISTLAPPCIKITEHLDRKIQPETTKSASS